MCLPSVRHTAVMRPQASQLQGVLASLEEAAHRYQEAEGKLKIGPAAEDLAALQARSGQALHSVPDARTLQSAVAPLVRYCQEKAKLFKVAQMLVNALCK